MKNGFGRSLRRRTVCGSPGRSTGMKTEEEGGDQGDGNVDQRLCPAEEEIAEIKGCWQPLTRYLPTVTNFHLDPVEDSRTGRTEQDQMYSRQFKGKLT